MDQETQAPPARVGRREPLPAPPTPLVGRDRELHEVSERLRPGADRPVRLLTLTGPGGTGKTRLALEVASRLEPAFPDGVAFAPLATLTDAGLVLPTIAQVLAVPEAAGEPLERTVGDYLAEHSLLLVLDNFEQVLGAAAVVGRLLAAAGRQRVLVTSQAALRVVGEQEYPVPQLGLPDLARLPAPEALADYGSVRLFLERAQAVEPRFELTPGNAAAVAEICVRLDGLPLAIELAAARVKLLPPEAILSRLADRLTLLAGGARDLPARHQTMRGAIDWSYDLLQPPERRLMDRLGVFVGGATLDAVEVVCADAGTDLFETLGSLVDKSLLCLTTTTDEPRFDMLQSVRDYAVQRLSTSGETSTLLERHAAYYLSLVERGRPGLTRALGPDRLALLTPELENLRAALRWAIDGGRVESAARLTLGLYSAWYDGGRIGEGLHWADAVLAAGGTLPDRLRAELLNSVGTLALENGDPSRAVSALQDALTHFRALALPADAARCLHTLAWVALLQGAPERAAQLVEDGLRLAEQAGDRLRVARLQNTKGDVAERLGDLATARTHYLEYLRTARALNNDADVAGALSRLALVDLAEDDNAAAGRAVESLAAARRAGAVPVLADALVVAGLLALESGDIAGATKHYLESLDLRHRSGQALMYELSLPGLAAAARELGDPLRSARLFGAAEQRREVSGTDATGRILADRYSHHLAELREQLEQATLTRAWAEGKAMSVEALLAYAAQPAEAPASRPVDEPSAAKAATPAPGTGAGSWLPGVESLVEVGRGGFAVVYQGWQAGFQRHVAVKVITATLDPEMAARFERECLAIGALSGHPNIVTVHELGRTGDGRPYIVMEFLGRGSLAQRVEHGEPLPWFQATEMAVKLAGALESAHHAGVLHRDVKPENVLLSRYGEPKLADFGIARVAGGSETRSGVVTASLAHAPPEVLEGKRPTAVADVYSLAATLFTFLTGRAPFVHGDEESVLPIFMRTLTEPVPDLRPEGVPEQLCAVIERAMSKDPETRPASAAEFGELLQAVQAAAGLAVTQLPVAEPEPEPVPGLGRRSERGHAPEEETAPEPPAEPAAGQGPWSDPARLQPDSWPNAGDHLAGVTRQGPQRGPAPVASGTVVVEPTFPPPPPSSPEADDATSAGD